MEEAYYLENSDILVEPKIFGISKNELKFEWINIEENKVIGTDSRITLLKKGDYQLKINTKEGCKKILSNQFQLNIFFYLNFHFFW